MDSKEGEKLVRFARETVENYLNGRSRDELLRRAEEELSEFREPTGVFVTINIQRELRGCIGYPEPVYPLNDALVLSAIAAATEDPRFLPIDTEDLERVTFEITILTNPQKIECETPGELVQLIEVGRDGLIAEKGQYRGLLLPQVPAEWGWDAEEFLSQTCRKAGMPKNEWRKNTVTFYKFQGEIFREKESKEK